MGLRHARSRDPQVVAFLEEAGRPHTDRPRSLPRRVEAVSADEVLTMTRAEFEDHIKSASEQSAQFVLTEIAERLAAVLPTPLPVGDDGLVTHDEFSHTTAITCDRCPGFPHAKCVHVSQLGALFAPSAHRQRVHADLAAIDAIVKRNSSRGPGA